MRIKEGTDQAGDDFDAIESKSIYVKKLNA